MVDQDELVASLRARIEALERIVASLKARVDALEAGAGVAGVAEFHIPDEEPTV
jgi:hypothetical protein